MKNCPTKTGSLFFVKLYQVVNCVRIWVFWDCVLNFNMFVSLETSFRIFFVRQLFLRWLDQPNLAFLKPARRAFFTTIHICLKGLIYIKAMHVELWTICSSEPWNFRTAPSLHQTIKRRSTCDRIRDHLTITDAYFSLSNNNHYHQIHRPL